MFSLRIFGARKPPQMTILKTTKSQPHGKSTLYYELITAILRYITKLRVFESLNADLCLKCLRGGFETSHIYIYICIYIGGWGE